MLSLAVERNNPEVIKLLFNADPQEKQRDILTGKIPYGYWGGIRSGNIQNTEPM